MNQFESFIVSVDESTSTVEALDRQGAVIVSLQYDNLDDLCSASFRKFVRDAVAATLSLDTSQVMEVEAEEEAEKCMMMMWQEEMEAELENERRTCADADRVLAMALELQMKVEEEKEEEEKDKKEMMARKMGVWGQINQACPERARVPALKRAETVLDEGSYPRLPDVKQCTPNLPGFVTRKKHVSKYLDGHVRFRDGEWCGMAAGQSYYDETDVGMMEGWRKAEGSLNGVIETQVDGSTKKAIILAANAHTDRDDRLSPDSCERSIRADKQGKCKDEVAGNESDELDREKYSRKSMRKLVIDMIKAGWRPLPGRGGGHHVYERIVTLSGGVRHKQLFVLPCTPSDRRTIDIVYSKLLGKDHEVMQLNQSRE